MQKIIRKKAVKRRKIIIIRLREATAREIKREDKITVKGKGKPWHLQKNAVVFFLHRGLRLQDLPLNSSLWMLW